MISLKSTRSLSASRTRNAVMSCLLVMMAAGATGCGREFFREWANQDVSEAVFEKTRDPRWRLDLFSHTPPAMSRFADPYDPDNPPAPPDDFAAAALSPVPQNPDNRLIVPLEGTGYLTMLDQWQREQDPNVNTSMGRQGLNISMPAGMGRPDVDLGPTTAPTPAPPAGGTSPFRQNGPGNAAPLPPPPSIPGPANPNGPRSSSNSGTSGRSMTPISRALAKAPSAVGGEDVGSLLRTYQGKIKAAEQPSTVSRTVPATNPANSPIILKDAGVQRTSLQQSSAPPSGPGRPMNTPNANPAASAPAANPRQVPANRPAPPDQLQTPRLPQDPNPTDTNLAAPVNPRPDLNPNQANAAQELTGLLAPREIPFYEAEAAGLPRDSRPYVVTMEQAFTLALINSRTYQYRLENLYLAALPVALARFNFMPQFFAGFSPSTGILGPAGLTISPTINPGTSFLYTTKETGTQRSTLNLGTVAGVGKVFNTGGRILASFASQVVFNFTGSRPAQPNVQSFLPIQIVQPFLKGGGRAVTLENLTQQERGLVYEARTFAKFRQEFVITTLVGGQAAIAFGTSAQVTGFSGGGNSDPTVGFLNVVEDIQTVENDVRNVATYEQFLKVYQELIKGESSGLAQLQVDQINQNLQNARAQLLNDQLTFRNDIDQFKIQLGLPPDVPMVVDRSLTAPFKRVFEAVEDWSRNPKRELADLDAIAAKLPQLEDVVVDGRSVLKVANEQDLNLEELLLTAERVGLENRLDIMNARANLYDAWRQIRVSANALKGVFNVTVTNQILTPPNTTNPFGFSDQAKNFQLVLNGELPLVRMNERNTFVGNLINYQRQRRTLMNNEDNLKYQIRLDIRRVQQDYRIFEINRRNYVLSVRQKDQSFENIVAPPAQAAGSNTQGAIQTQNLIQAQNSVISQQNQLVKNWLQYQIDRLQLYRDLGTLPFDEWEAFYEFFPQTINATDRPGVSPVAPGSQPGPFGGSFERPPGVGSLPEGVGAL